MGFNSAQTTSGALGLSGRRFTMQVFDLGGGRNIRRVWKSYLAEVHAVVFVVDAADGGRLPECKQVSTTPCTAGVAPGGCPVAATRGT